MIDNSVPAVVFRSEIYPSLGIIRSLGRMGVDVYCIDSDRHALGLASRYCRKGFLWDFGADDDERLVSYLIDVAREAGERPVLIPTGDTRNLLVDRYRSELSEWYRLPQPAAGSMAALYSKRTLYELCLREAVPTPATMFPTSIEEAEAAGQSLGFPLAIKAIDPDRLERRTGSRIAIVHNASELRERYLQFDEPGVANLALQQFIPDASTNAWMTAAYFDGKSDCRFALTGRKLRQEPIHGGVTTLGITVPCPAMVDSISRVAKAANYCGIIGADYLYDCRDGQWKLVDVNPRAGANFRLFVDNNGTDVVRALYFDLTGQEIPATDAIWGRKWLVEDGDIIALTQHRKEDSLSVNEWLKSLRGISELAHMAADDPRPSAIFASRMAKHVVQSVARRAYRRILGIGRI
jgi:predicted ATP-grasp superfamily ATP-dependent carboligase